MTRSNATIGVSPSLFTSLAAAEYPFDRPGEVLAVIGSVCYALLATYAFDLSNQIAGLAEDELNKPNRPLVTGFLSLTGARHRLQVICLLLLCFGTAMGVGWWTIGWIAVFIANNHLGVAKTPYGKPAIVGVQAFMQLMTAWLIVREPSSRETAWIGLTSFTLALLMPLQDIRDVAGDQAIGRRTIPIQFGEYATRLYLQLVLLCSIPILHYTAFAYMETKDEGVTEGLLASICALIAIRLATCQGTREDDRTYRLLVLWYVLMSLVPFSSSIF
ncbi:UbiA family prenyltransferase [Streptomyces djakartensis]|uniref:UbiA family prenyltransferase n=1 Tax=Streptomyces djakartensis TaxID=68193 RepID=UPI0034E04D1D